MADLATLQSRLADAETARHNLVIGGQVEDVQHGDMRQRYTKADLPRLDAYISDLRAQIVAAGGSVDGLRRRALVIDLPERP